MIELKNISKSFKQWGETINLYNNLSLKIESWTFVMLTGSSGSWKTTLFNIIAGLETIDTGEVIVDGKRIDTLSNAGSTKYRASTIWFVFQKFHLVSQLTVRENLELPGDLSNLERRYTTQEILSLVWINQKIDVYPDQLSWWEQQRVAIARAFMYQTPILLTDEPTGNLDQGNSENIMQLIKKLQKDTGVTILMITHEQDLLHWADRVVAMNELIGQ